MMTMENKETGKELDKAGLITYAEYELLPAEEREKYRTFIGSDGKVYAFEITKRPDLYEEMKKYQSDTGDFIDM